MDETPCRVSVALEFDPASRRAIARGANQLHDRSFSTTREVYDLPITSKQITTILQWINLTRQINEFTKHHQAVGGFEPTVPVL